MSDAIIPALKHRIPSELRGNSGTKWSYGDDGAVGEEDNPDEARGDDDDDGDREGISPADFSLPESFSLSVVSAPEAAAEYFFEASPDVFRSEGGYRRKGGSRRRPRAARWAPGAVQGWTAARWRLACWWLPSAPSSGSFRLLTK